MSKIALFVAALVLTPVLGGCFGGEATGMFTDNQQVANDGRPAPGAGDYGSHLGSGATYTWNRLGHSAHTLHWMFLHTNSEDVPYETWADDQLPRAMYSMSKTVDVHLLNYNWDDPFCGERW